MIPTPLQCLLLALATPFAAIAQPTNARPLARPLARPETRNVVLVVTDGLRWQDVFTGADSLLVFGDPGVIGGDTAAVRARYWRRTAAARRETLMPFLWGTIARHGQLFGDREQGSLMDVTNGMKFSYPGYNEMLVGYPDPRIDRNDYGPNPNATVFEWLERQPGFRGRTAAIATWDAFADIFARARSGVYVQAGWEPPYPHPRSAADSVLDRLYATTFRLWGDNVYDAFTHEVAMRYLREHTPRVLFIGYGETDEWAHEGRYDRLLESAHEVDGYLAELWNTLQSMPQYRGTTTLIVTTDHGRGRTVHDWTDHGESVVGAEEVWLAIIGPGTPALGERGSDRRATQAQIPSTLAAALGLDYRTAVRRAAPALAGAITP